MCQTCTGNDLLIYTVFVLFVVNVLAINSQTAFKQQHIKWPPLLGGQILVLMGALLFALSLSSFQRPGHYAFPPKVVV